MLRELISVIITPPITPNNVWGISKRNFQEKITPPCPVLLGGYTIFYTKKFSGN